MSSYTARRANEKKGLFSYGSQETTVRQRSLFKEGRGWAIRWREREIAPDGTIKKRLCYEALGNISRAEAGEILRRKMAEFGSSDGPTRSRVTFLTLAQQWEVDVLPTKYKHSTQKNHQHIMEKHLIPRFGELALCDVTTPAIQTYVTHLIKAGYAPKSIDHIHDVMSAILRYGGQMGASASESRSRGRDADA